MEPLHQFLPAAIAAIIRDAPLSPGKVALAWRVAVGPAIDRVTSVTLAGGGVLEVRADDQHWHRELCRLAPLILDRLALQLGPGTVRRLAVTGAGPARLPQPAARRSEVP